MGVPRYRRQGGHVRPAGRVARLDLGVCPVEVGITTFWKVFVDGLKTEAAMVSAVAWVWFDVCGSSPMTRLPSGPSTAPMTAWPGRKPHPGTASVERL